MIAASTDIETIKALITIEVVEADLANPKIDEGKLAKVLFSQVADLIEQWISKHVPN